jgi:hypothetical protein
VNAVPPIFSTSGFCAFSDHPALSVAGSMPVPTRVSGYLVCWWRIRHAGFDKSADGQCGVDGGQAGGGMVGEYSCTPGAVYGDDGVVEDTENDGSGQRGERGRVAGR